MHPVWYKTQPDRGQDCLFWVVTDWGKSSVPLKPRMIVVKTARKNTQVLPALAAKGR